jgi:hypothetical protein
MIFHGSPNINKNLKLLIYLQKNHYYLIYPNVFHLHLLFIILTRMIFF